MTNQAAPFTFQNVWERRAEFEAAVKDAVKEDETGADEYNELISAKSKKDFMRFIYSNFYWINKEIDNFKPKHSYAGDFSGRLALVEEGGKYGYIRKNGKYLFEPQFDDAEQLYNGCAWITKDGKCGYIMEYGKYFFEPQFDGLYIDYSKNYVILSGDGRKFKLTKMKEKKDMQTFEVIEKKTIIIDGDDCSKDCPELSQFHNGLVCARYGWEDLVTENYIHVKRCKECLAEFKDEEETEK